MNQQASKNNVKRIALATAIALFSSSSVHAVNWIGTANGTWNTPANWDASFPNSIGAIASKSNTLNPFNIVTTQNVAGGVTLGTLELTGSSNNSWGITLSNPLNINQDGAGGVAAEIRNTSTGAGANNQLLISSGTINLADDLIIRNTATASTTANGAIRIASLIAGTGSVTFINDVNTTPTSTVNYPGGIRIDSNVNSFVGNVNVAKGLVVYNNSRSLGDIMNTVTIGATGMGSASMFSSNGTTTIPNNIVVASGSGGTLTVGALEVTNFTPYTGNFTLNGDLSIHAASGLAFNAVHTYSGNFSGGGNITKTGPGSALLSGTNTNTGTVTVSTGVLLFDREASLYNNVQSNWNATNIVVPNGTGLGVSLGTGKWTDANVATLNAVGSGVGGFLPGSSLALNPTVASYQYSLPVTNSNSGANSIGLAKVGVNELVTSAANTYTGRTTVLDGILRFTTPTAFYSGNSANWDANHIFVPGGTLAFNVGGSGEFTPSQIATISTAGSATSGFIGGSLGIDTRNAAAETVFAPSLGNAGPNALNLRKLGVNTLTFTGANTYTGATIVDGGVLKLAAGSSHATPESNYTIGSATGTNGEIIFDGANVTSNAGMLVGAIGTGKATVNGGTLQFRNDDAGGGQFVGIGINSGAVGTYIQNGGSVSVGTGVNGSDWFVTGLNNGSVGNTTINGGTLTARVFEIGQNGGSTGNFLMTGGTINTLIDWFRVGDNGTGHGVQNEDTGPSVINTDVFSVAVGAASVSDYTLNAGTINVRAFLPALSGNGTFTMNGGNVNVNGFTNVGEASGSNGFLNINGGTFTSKDVRVGRAGTAKGTVTQTGGTFSGTSFLTLGELGPTTGTYNLSAGSLTTGNNIVVGYEGTGTFNQTGGTVVTGTAFSLGDRPVTVSNLSNGTYNMSGGSLNVTNNFEVGFFGKGTVNQSNSSTIIVNGETFVGNQTGSTGTYTLNGGTLIANNWISIGAAGTGTFTQNGGSIVASVNVGAVGVGRYATGNGTYTMNHGSLLVINDWLVGGILGTGNISILNDSSVIALNLAAAQLSGSTGTITINNPGGSINLANLDPVAISQPVPSIVPIPGTGSLLAGLGSSTNGTINMIAGTVTHGGSALIGNSGTGTLNMSGGSITTGDNFRLGNEATGVGNLTMSAGTITLDAYYPTYSGNFIVSYLGQSTVNMTGGLIDLTASNISENTLNSATYSIANNTNGPGHELDLSQSGNLIIAEGSGTGVFNQSGGTVNVSANIFVGGADFVNGVGGKGTLSISNTAHIHVGLHSPTGGDLVLGSPVPASPGPVSQATVNLSGGLLDVAHGSGSIVSGGGGTVQFNFTGGTLKVISWNPTTTVGGNLGNLTQNGSGSVLDVTTNSTTLHSGYDLGAGTVNVANGNSLTIAQGMINSAGTGVMNINSSGSVTSNNIRTETLSLNNGNATVRTSGGTAGASKVETLNMVGTSKLNLKDNDLVVGTAASVDAVRDAIVAGKANNAASGITSDLPAFGTTTGFGYAMGNDAAISPLLAGSLSGQSYDTDSVLVKYTFLGDADLDGDSDLNDLGLWAQAFTGDLGNPVNPATYWTSGDFDYDGDTDLNDLGFWAGTFTGDLGGGAGSLIVHAPNAPAGAVAALNSMGITVVPEPSTFVLAGVGLAGLAIAARRKRIA